MAEEVELDAELIAVYHVEAGDRFDVTIGMPVSARPADVADPADYVTEVVAPLP